MNNRINPYQNALIPSLQQAVPRSEAPAPADKAASPAPRAEAVAPAHKGADVDGLTPVEQQMINRYFPKSESMTLRLYSANRNAQTINPGAVGTRLDVRG